MGLTILNDNMGESKYLCDKQRALDIITEKASELTDLSDQLWDHPEIKYKEFFASGLLSDYLEQNGFRVSRMAAGIPTAFVAEYGEGAPVIGLLAEYDALEGMSQKAESDTESPVVPGKPGHGCGHNLLGTGAVGAALAVQAYLKTGHRGTVRLFGCPAEEGGSGKTFMARDHVFDGLDAAFTWHPGDINSVSSGSNLANCQVEYRFKGKKAHAALSPEKGRSALDAAELMNVGIQFLREHIPLSCRIHYAFTDSGGSSPNVVQSSSGVLYQMRAPKLDLVRELRERVDDIARGAALMTGTELTIHFIKATSNVVPNTTLGKVMQKNLETLGAADYDEADYGLAEKMRATIDEPDPYYLDCINSQVDDPKIKERLLKDRNSPLYPQIFPYPAREEQSLASSDVGDVSWICPTAQIQMATMPGGTVMHSWQEVAVGKSAMAHKGMLQAARVIAASAIDVLEAPETIAQAKEELAERTDGKPYLSPIPQDVKPPM